MSICPEFEGRAVMDDGQFWDHVFNRGATEPDDFDGDDTPTTYQTDPCPECGEWGACAYDAEGRALVHIETEARP